MLLLLAVRLVIFSMNMKEEFDVSMFWQSKSWKEMTRDCCHDEKILDEFIEI